MKRGDVWIADQPPPVGRRAVLLVARNASYEQRDYVIVCPVTTRHRYLRSEVLLGSPEGVQRPSVANLDTLNTIPKRR